MNIHDNKKHVRTRNLRNFELYLFILYFVKRFLILFIAADYKNY